MALASALRHAARAVAVWLLVVTMSVSGCAALLFGGFGSEGPGYAGSGPSKLRVAIYEPRRAFLVPHVSIIIHSPDEHLIYDPAGWTPDPRGHRIADVTYSITPDVERAFVLRLPPESRQIGVGSRAKPESWDLFLFDITVSDDVARAAARLARDRPAAPVSGCAFGASGLLRQLPGFEDVRTCLLPSELRKQLEARDDTILYRLLVPPVQGG